MFHQLNEDRVHEGADNMDNPKQPNSRRDTVITYGSSFHEVDDDDIMPIDSCCCGKVQILKAGKALALASLAGAVLNWTMLILGHSRFSAYLELVVLTADLFTLVALLYGVAHRRSVFLKPYLVYNLVWNMLLVVLFLLCAAQLIRGGNLPRNLFDQARKTFSWSSEDDVERNFYDDFTTPPPPSESAETTLAILLIAALALAILVNFWFLQVVYRAFQYIAYKEEKGMADDVTGASVPA